MNRMFMLKLSSRGDYNLKEEQGPKEVNDGENLINDIIYSGIPKEKKVTSALGPRQRSYVLDYLSNFLYYPKHGEILKRSDDKMLSYV